MKKRTRQQKERAGQKRLQTVEYQYKDTEKKSSPDSSKLPQSSQLLKNSREVTASVRASYAHELFPYDATFIYKDLQKTFVFVTGIFVLLGILTRVLLGH